jgi:hypothetical protein
MFSVPLVISKGAHRPGICVWFSTFRTHNIASEHLAGSKQKSHKTMKCSKRKINRSSTQEVQEAAMGLMMVQET